MSASRSWWPKRRDAVALAAVLACLPLSAPAPAAAAAQVPTTQTTLTCEALPDDDWCEEWVIAAHLRDDGAKGLGLSAELSRDGRQLFMMSYRSCPFGSSCVDSQHVAVAAFDTATGERLWSASRWLSPDGSKPGVVSFPKLAVNPDASKVFVVATEVTDTGAKAGGRWTQTTVTLAYNAVAPRSPGDPALDDLLWTDRMDVASDATKAEIEDSTGEGVAVTPDGSTVLVLAVSRSPAWGTGGGAGGASYDGL